MTSSISFCSLLVFIDNLNIDASIELSTGGEGGVLEITQQQAITYTSIIYTIYSRRSNDCGLQLMANAISVR